MKKITVLIGIVLLVASCNKDNGNIGSDVLTPLPDEIYDIYGSLLYPLSSVNLVVTPTDTSLNCADFLLMNIDTVGVTPYIINECVRANRSSYTLEKDKLLSGGLTLVSREELEMSTPADDILQKYGAVGMFSFGYPVIFNDGKEAIFEMSHYCGSLCGNGAIIIAEKQNNTWGVKYYFGTWISK